MAFIPTPNAIKLVLEFTLSGQVVVVTISLQKAAALTTADLTAAATAGKQWWKTYLKPLSGPQLALTGATAYDLTTASSPVVHVPESPPDPGTNAAECLPANAAAVISWRTANRGRSARGRMYVPGLTEGGNSNGINIAPTTQAAIAVAAANLASFFTPSLLNHVVISRFLNGVARAQGLSQAVTANIVDDLWDSQRRRLGGRGI